MPQPFPHGSQQLLLQQGTWISLQTRLQTLTQYVSVSQRGEHIRCMCRSFLRKRSSKICSKRSWFAFRNGTFERSKFWCGFRNGTFERSSFWFVFRNGTFERSSSWFVFRNAIFERSKFWCVFQACKPLHSRCKASLHNETWGNTYWNFAALDFWNPYFSAYGSVARCTSARIAIATV